MRIKLTFVNVGYGEAILLEGYENEKDKADFVAVIDGGSRDAMEYEGSDSGRIPLIDYMRKQQMEQVNLLIVTHPHEDHICGLIPVVEEYHPMCIYQILPITYQKEIMRKLNPYVCGNKYRQNFIKALNDSILLTELIESYGGKNLLTSDELQNAFLEDIRCKVLAPSCECFIQLTEAVKNLYRENRKSDFLQQLEVLDAAMNNYSLVLQFSCNGRQILLPGDMNAAGLLMIKDKLKKVDIFKVGHHGQKDSISEEVLDILSPDIIVCCASSDNRFDSACPKFLSSTRNRGINLFFSDCPEGEGISLEPHQAVSFWIEENSKIIAQYVQIF